MTAVDSNLAQAVPRAVPQVFTPADRAFRLISRSAGTVVLAIMLLVGIFLTANSVRAVHSVGVWTFITTQVWAPETNDFGIAAVLTGSVIIAVVALFVSVPMAVGASLFITEIASGGFRKTLTSTVDLMAAVPSVVFGLWGFYFLQPHFVGFAEWLSTYFGWIPIFAVRGVDPSNPLPNPALFTSSSGLAGLVVGAMIIPIQTSMMVETFSRAPIGEREGAFALGGTRWGVIRRVVLPFGKGGMIGGIMLGLGRALGETIAVYLIISPIFHIKIQLFAKGGDSTAALIALRYGEANKLSTSALMAAGLSLFILTMAINFTASAVIARSRSGAESEG